MGVSISANARIVGFMNDNILFALFLPFVIFIACEVDTSFWRIVTKGSPSLVRR